MSTLSWASEDKSSLKILLVSTLLAMILEFSALVLVGRAPSLHPPQTLAPEEASHFVETEMVELPKPEHLIERKKEVSKPIAKEATLSKHANRGATATEKTLTDEQNVTQAAPELAPTHGPIAVYSPRPIIPPYLLDKEIKAHVLIDFFVNAFGVTTPRLVGSSGNEELDAIALNTAKKWQFRPAEDNRQAIDSKVRLKILFEVQ